MSPQMVSNSLRTVCPPFTQTAFSKWALASAISVRAAQQRLSVGPRWQEWPAGELPQTPEDVLAEHRARDPWEGTNPTADTTHPFVFLSSTPSPRRAFVCACPLGRGGGHNQLALSSRALPLKGKSDKRWTCLNRCPNQRMGLSCPWSSGRAGEVQVHRRPEGISHGPGMPIL